MLALVPLQDGWLAVGYARGVYFVRVSVADASVQPLCVPCEPLGTVNCTGLSVCDASHLSVTRPPAPPPQPAAHTDQADSQQTDTQTDHAAAAAEAPAVASAASTAAAIAIGTAAALTARPTHVLLVAVRASGAGNAALRVCDLSCSADGVTCVVRAERLQDRTCERVLSRARLFAVGRELYAVAGDAATCEVCHRHRTIHPA